MIGHLFFKYWQFLHIFLQLFLLLAVYSVVDGYLYIYYLQFVLIFACWHFILFVGSFTQFLAVSYQLLTLPIQFLIVVSSSSALVACGVFNWWHEQFSHNKGNIILSSYARWYCKLASAAVLEPHRGGELLFYSLSSFSTFSFYVLTVLFLGASIVCVKNL